jgi:predicted dehydrogenase
MSTSASTRRDFLKASAAAAAGVALAANVHAAGNDTIKVGLIGCGGRGTGAAHNVLDSAPNVKIVGLGDVFDFQVKRAQAGLREVKNKYGNTANVPDDRCFSGLDAYKRVIDSDANYIILATPPGFRPYHLEAAVGAGKNIFTEKPVATDGPGIRRVFAAYEQAQKKGLHIVAGTQRRHQAPYIETIKRIHDGAIGELVGGRGYWNQGILWKRSNPSLPPLGQQILNWYAYVALCGDHIVEQHVHNIDVLNWAFKGHPSAAVGMGFRTPRDEGYGHIYDFFAIDFEWANGVHTLSMCRQISNCANSVSEHLVGTKGKCDVNTYNINGERVATRGGTDPYVQEHTDLIASIRSGKPLNELKHVAESTLTAIMGRMSAYTGKKVTWDQALNSQEVLLPEHLDLNEPLPNLPVAIPGKTRLV